jgi:hypothetical protein
MLRNNAATTLDRLIVRTLGLAGLVLLVLAVGAGCTVLPSEKTAFPAGSTDAVPSPVVADTGDVSEDADAARAALQEALAAMRSEAADRYWYSGYIRNTMEKHQITSMFDGVVLRPKQAYLINARIAGQPYQYYRYEGKNYIKTRDRWFPLPGDAPLPFDPLRGFEDWLPLMDAAVRKPDETVLGIPVDVYEVRISGRNWVENAPSELFADLAARIADDEELRRLLDETIVKTTLRIGKEDRFLYEYDTWIVMPVPGAGYADQRTFVRLYRFGDPSIETKQLPLPEKIQDWVDRYKEIEANDGPPIAE